MQVHTLFLFARSRATVVHGVIYAADSSTDSSHVTVYSPRALWPTIGWQTDENAHCISIVFALDRENNGDN